MKEFSPRVSWTKTVPRAQSKLDENRSQSVYGHVAFGVAYGIFRSTEEIEERALKQEHQNRQRNRKENKGGGAVSENLFCVGVVPSAHVDAGFRRASHSHETRKGRDYHNQREAHSESRKGHRPRFRYVSYVHSVHHVVESVYDLRRYGRNGQRGEKPTHRFRSQVCFFRCGKFIQKLHLVISV